jgi:predicted DNA-binding transcriptional regulator AlpA
MGFRYLKFKGKKMQFQTVNSQTSFGFYRLPAVLQKIPVSRSAWFAGIKAGRYPQGVKIAPRTTAWSQLDIEELCSRLEKEGKK